MVFYRNSLYDFHTNPIKIFTRQVFEETIFIFFPRSVIL